MFVLLGPVIYTQDQRPVATQVFKFKQAWRNELRAPATGAREAPTCVPLKEKLIKALLFVLVSPLKLAGIPAPHSPKPLL